MAIKVLAMYDEKAEAYGPLLCAPTRGIALRTLSDALSRSNSPLAQYPEDHKLYELGEFDEVAGRIVAYDQPVFIVAAATVKRQLEEARRSASQVAPAAAPAEKPVRLPPMCKPKEVKEEAKA